MSNRKSNAGFFAAIILVAVLVLGYFTSPWWSYGTDRVTVTGTTVKVYSHHSKYLAFTSGGVFENTDTWWFLKFNSSDIQGQLMQGGTFDISHTGFRVPFFSKYPNITNVQRVK